MARNKKQNPRVYTDKDGNDIFRRDNGASKGSKYYKNKRDTNKKTSVKQAEVEAKIKPTVATKGQVKQGDGIRTYKMPEQKALPNKSTGLATTEQPRVLKQMGKADVVKPSSLKGAGVIGLGVSAALALPSMPSSKEVLEKMPKKPKVDKVATTHNIGAVGSKSVALKKAAPIKDTPVANVDIRKKRDLAQEAADARTRASVDNPRITPVKKSKYKIERADVWKDYFND